MRRLLAWRDPPEAREPPSARELAEEVDELFAIHTLGCWFPRCVDDRRGGFFQNFARDWSHGREDPRSLVFQARMTWVAASVARRRPERRARFGGFARRGAEFLSDSLWDERHGGFRWREGENGEKHSYGIAFAIYALAAVHRANGDRAALRRAELAFNWLDDFARDAQCGGYFEALRADGAPLLSPPKVRTSDRIGTPYGLKSSNAHLHLLEAFCELYRAKPLPRLRDRIDELRRLLIHSAERSGGELPTSSSRDWRPVDRTVSYGHWLEAAFLLVDACQTLGDAPTPIAAEWVDGALARGYDTRFGGVFATGRSGGPPTDRSKVWWVQAEALNSLLVLSGVFESRAASWRDVLRATWRFVRERQVDSRHPGWLAQTTRRGRPLDVRKGHEWKAAYHETRALLNAGDQLRAIASR